MRSSWIHQGNSKFNDKCSIRKGVTDRRGGTQGRSHVQKAEVWTLLPQAKEHRDIPPQPQRQEGVLLYIPGKESTLPGPWFKASGLQNCERINYYCFKTPSVVLCYGNPRKLIYPGNNNKRNKYCLSFRSTITSAYSQ